MRTSRNEIDNQGIVKNGFDYDLQVWVKDYICLDVGLNRNRYKGKDIRQIKTADPYEIIQKVAVLLGADPRLRLT